MARMTLSATAVTALVLSMGGALRAEPAANDPFAVPDVTVKRVEPKRSKHPTLTFLKENREFFRARLDFLRVTAGRNREGAAQGLDPRYAMLQSMLDDIRAAQDSAAAGVDWIQRRELLDSVGNLGQLEAQMDGMERLLAEQRERLFWLEEDFVGRQTTSLVVLLRGVPAAGAPTGVVLRDEEGGTQQIDLGAGLLASLTEGGTAELLHEFVEPRQLVYEVSFEGQRWDARAPFVVRVEPERDRMTFLELDLGGVGPSHPDSRLAARSWVR